MSGLIGENVCVTMYERRCTKGIHKRKYMNERLEETYERSI